MSNVHLYCLGALLVNEASRSGFPDFARTLETALGTLLSSLPRDEQGAALSLSYQMALNADEPVRPLLRLVSARD